MPDIPGGLVAALADRYTIERELGRGGMAVVYLAHDRTHDRKVAIKVLDQDATGSVKPERFLREIQIASQLTHPHILPLLDSGAAYGVLYYVMPYVPGESLRDRLRREHQLPVEDAVRITRDVAAALGHAHSHGVVHRDIKPENILLDGDAAVVMDFGIARAVTAAGDESGTLTKTGTSVGTPIYMSPEQAGGSERLDGRADLYSLGCVLYEMLAGHPPFTGQSAQEILARHVMDAVPSLKAARAAIPESVESALRRVLAKQPADRFATAAQFAEALTARVSTPSRRRAILYAVLGALVLGGVAVAGRRWLPGAPAISAHSVAVLPFVNLSTDEGDAYLSEGITEELINALSQVGELRVPGRTSSFAFQGKNVPLKDMARELGVATLVEGSVRQQGDRLRVTCRLVKAADGFQLWSQQYDRVLRNAQDIFAIQDDISHAIVSALQLKLAPAPAPARPENLEAYQLYLKGRLFFNKGTEDGLKRALEFFSAAIAQDSAYARAYAGLADAYERHLNLRYLSRADAYPKARAAAERAVALDSQLAEAYTSRGQIRYRYEWDWSGGEQDFRRAVALNPGYALAHVWYGQFLVLRGRSAEGVREARRAAELDPLSVPVLSQYTQVLYYARQYGPALEQARKSFELEPSAFAHQQLANIYLQQNRFADAIREYQTALGLLGGRGRVSTNLSHLGYTYARAGQRPEALRILDDLKARAARRDSGLIGYAFNLASLYGVLGEKDEAFECLEEAYQEHDFNLPILRVLPFFDPLRSDPRFTRLLKKVGLEP